MHERRKACGIWPLDVVAVKLVGTWKGIAASSERGKAQTWPERVREGFHDYEIRHENGTGARVLVPPLKLP